MRPVTKDLIAAAGLLLIAALYYAAAVRIPISALADEFGPRGLPAALAALLAIVAILIGLRALLAPRAAPAGEAEPEAPPLRAAGLVAIGALYIPAASFLGYVPAIVFVIAAVALYEGMKPSLRLAAVTICGAAFFWLLFAVVLGVPQPSGIFF